MLRILGRNATACDGLTRRDLLAVATEQRHISDGERWRSLSTRGADVPLSRAMHALVSKRCI